MSGGMCQVTSEPHGPNSKEDTWLLGTRIMVGVAQQEENPSQSWESSSFHGGPAQSRDPPLLAGARAMVQEGDALTSADSLVPGLDPLSHPPSQAHERQL